jgi:hypothetical protein
MEDPIQNHMDDLGATPMDWKPPNLKRVFSEKFTRMEREIPVDLLQ